MSKYNEAQKRAIMKYMSNNIGKVTLTIPKDKKALYNEEAKKRGLSLTKLICNCVDKEIGG